MLESTTSQDTGCKDNPKVVNSKLRSKATRQLELELNFELSDDAQELSTAELKTRGLLKKIHEREND